MDNEGDILVQWWLDSSALPDLYWARLQINTHGTAEIRDLDDRIHHFSTIEEARQFLREDEYQPLHELIEEGLVSASTQHPPSFI